MILVVSLTARPVAGWTFPHSHSPKRSFGVGCFIPFLPTPSLPLLWSISFYAFLCSGLSSPWGFPISPPKFVCGINSGNCSSELVFSSFFLWNVDYMC